MEELDILITQAGDNPQILQTVDTIRAKYGETVNKMQEYETKIAGYDTKMADVVNSRDKLKNTIRETLGINEVSKDSILEKLNSIGDAELKRSFDEQLNTFKKESGSKIDELSSTLGQYESEIKALKMKNAISTTEVMGQVNGTKAGEMLQNLLAEGAEFDEEGNLKYIGQAGETILNTQGDAMTLDDKITQLKQSKEYDFLFQTRFLNGGGAPTPGGTPPTPGGSPAPGGAKLTRTTMDMEDKIAYRDKYGEDAYNSLPLV